MQLEPRNRDQRISSHFWSELWGACLAEGEVVYRQRGHSKASLGKPSQDSCKPQSEPHLPSSACLTL